VASCDLCTMNRKQDMFKMTNVDVAEYFVWSTMQKRVFFLTCIVCSFYSSIMSYFSLTDQTNSATPIEHYQEEVEERR
jgi:Golgi nucleoside diphosphatase